jgi:hypothetical protein
VIREDYLVEVLTGHLLAVVAAMEAAAVVVIALLVDGLFSKFQICRFNLMFRLIRMRGIHLLLAMEQQPEHLRPAVQRLALLLPLVEH